MSEMQKFDLSVTDRQVIHQLIMNQDSIIWDADLKPDFILDEYNMSVKEFREWADKMLSDIGTP